MSELRQLVVVGDGIDAWIAAAGLRRAFRTRPLDVSIVPTQGAAGSRVGRRVGTRAATATLRLLRLRHVGSATMVIAPAGHSAAQMPQPLQYSRSIT